MIVIVNFFKHNITRKVNAVNIKYHMTLKAIFNELLHHHFISYGCLAFFLHWN